MTPNSDRNHLIDSLRAVALFGVVTMNLLAMVMAFVAGPIMAAAQPVDFGFAAFDLILLQGKARSTFALLFGVGFGILLARATVHGHDFTGFYVRRMLALLAIGIVNLMFLYWGDILILYALLGMVLWLFRRWSDRALLGFGLTLIVVPPLLVGLAEAITGAPLPNLGGLSLEQARAVVEASVPAYQSGSYADMMAANVRHYIERHRDDTASMAVYQIGVLGLFLIGFWVTRNGVLADVERWRPFLRRTAWLCLPVGLAISAIHGSRQMGIETTGAGYALVSAAYVGLPIMAFGYIAAFALLLHGRGRWLQRGLSPVGRMALTGYLASNLIGSFIWYGWGLGLMGTMNVAAMNLIAFAVFGALAVFSAIWLRAFRFGPVEWMWRCLSYGRLQPIRTHPAGAEPLAG